jgi:hypothetical protein
MPTEIPRPPAAITESGRVPTTSSHDAGRLSLALLAIIAGLVLLLHFAGSAMIVRSHASPVITAPDAGMKCPAEAVPAEQQLYD